MELKDIVSKYGIVGVISNYESSLNVKKAIIDLNINSFEKYAKILNLNVNINDKLEDLSIRELWLVELISKLDESIIIIGNMSNSLIKKDREAVNKLLIKLNKENNKKIVIIDNDVTVFMNLVKYICVIKNKELIYSTNNFYDKKLYQYTRKPKIVEFVNYVNNNKKILQENTDIQELIKDIYRSKL